MADSAVVKGLDDFAAKSSNFVTWFDSADSTRLSSKIQLVDRRGRGAGRAVVAVQDIAEDEELFAVPRRLVLSASTSSIPPAVLEPLQETGNWPPLIVTIIYEYLQGDSSPWYPYIQVLPTTFETLMFWQPSELAELQASAVVNKIGKEDAEAAWKSTIIPLMLANPEIFPVQSNDEPGKVEELIKLAHLAGSLIMAYAFDIDNDDDNKPEAESPSDEFVEDDEDEPLKGMVPFADMLNAEADWNNARLFQEDDYLIMKATKSISASDEIFNDYGPLPRSDLLRMYGYVTDNYARYDVIEFSHCLLEQVAGRSDAKKNSIWLKRKEALEELGLIDDGYSLSRPELGTKLEDIVPGQLHMLLRGLCLEDGSTKMPKMNYNESISIEEAALLSAVLMKKLSEYPTSAKHDTEIHSKLVADEYVEIPINVHRHRYQIALEVRRGEKETLQGLIAICQAHIEEKTRDIAATSTKRKHDDDAKGSNKASKNQKR